MTSEDPTDIVAKYNKSAMGTSSDVNVGTTKSWIDDLESYSLKFLRNTFSEEGSNNQRQAKDEDIMDCISSLTYRLEKSALNKILPMLANLVFLKDQNFARVKKKDEARKLVRQFERRISFKAQKRLDADFRLSKLSEFVESIRRFGEFLLESEGLEIRRESYSNICAQQGSGKPPNKGQTQLGCLEFLETVKSKDSEKCPYMKVMKLPKVDIAGCLGNPNKCKICTHSTSNGAEAKQIAYMKENKNQLVQLKENVSSPKDLKIEGLGLLRIPSLTRSQYRRELYIPGTQIFDIPLHCHGPPKPSNPGAASELKNRDGGFGAVLLPSENETECPKRKSYNRKFKNRSRNFSQSEKSTINKSPTDKRTQCQILGTESLRRPKTKACLEKSLKKL